MRFNQSGIAIGPILFIIAVLAVLAAAIAAGSGSFTAGTTNESSKLAAQAIIARADEMADAVQKVMLSHNCADTDISFYDAARSTSLNINSNAPSDKTCHIFDPAGGGLINLRFPATYFAKTSTYAESETGYFAYGSQNGYVGIDTTGSSALTLALWGLTDNVCIAINRMLGFNASNSFAPLSLSFWGGVNFTGTYSYQMQVTAWPTGYKAGCIVYENPGGVFNNIYNRILIAR